MLALIAQATKGDEILTNEVLPMPHVRYAFAAQGRVWGEEERSEEHTSELQSR